MHPLAPLTAFWTQLSTSLTTQLFTIGTIFVVIAVAKKVWLEAVLLKPIENMRLSDIERKHPHLPSLRAIIGTVLCTVALLLVLLEMIGGVPPFDEPQQALLLAGIFLLGCTVGILAELRSKRASEYTFALIVGTALAFLFLAYKSVVPLGHLLLSLDALAVLLLCILLVWKVFYTHWSRTAKLLTVAAYFFWVALYAGK